jgi:two-component system nitrogen regulation sensor histidine kinase NtrY
MGFDQRFTIGLIAWIVALVAVLLACIAAFATPGLGAARIVALAIAAATFAGLWRHVTRTNRTVARFLEALKFGDTALQFDAHGGAGFGELGASLNEALARFRAEQDRVAGELRYLDALVDDMPVAVLTVDAERPCHARQQGGAAAVHRRARARCPRISQPMARPSPGALRTLRRMKSY